MTHSCLWRCVVASTPVQVDSASTGRFYKFLVVKRLQAYTCCLISDGGAAPIRWRPEGGCRAKFWIRSAALVG